jgi:putative DNA primase/helicase
VTRELITAIARNLGAAPDPARLVPGHIVRFSTNGKRGDDAGWVKLFEDQLGATYGDWRRPGVSYTWQARASGSNQRRDVIAAAQAARAQERARRHEEIAQHAALIWSRAQRCERHRYLDRKCVDPDGVRVQFAHASECRGQFFHTGTDGQIEPLHGLLLLVPMRDAAKRIWSLQAIDGEGRKSFQRGGRVKGAFHLVGRELLRGVDIATTTMRVGIAEGLATAATVSQMNGMPVFVAFCAGNLELVAITVRQRMPVAALIIAGDADPVGRAKAIAAAAAVKGAVSIPEFSAGAIAAGLTDWNDWHRARGGEVAA